MMKYGVVAVLVTVLLIACEATIPATTVPVTVTPPAPATVFEESTEVPTPIERLTPTPIATPIPPSASFSVDVDSGNAPLTIEFNNTTQGPVTSTQWQFGDGGTSTEESPSYTFTAAGTYNVELTAVGGGGTDKHIILDLITVKPGPPVSLEVSPPDMTIAVQEIARFTVVARDEFGNVIPSTATWAVIGEIGSIDKDGLFTASTTAGTFNEAIEASIQTDAGKFTAFATAAVTPGEVSRIVVEPTEVTLDIGVPQAFTFTAFDTFANEIDDAIVAWTISPELGKFDANGVLTPGRRAGIFPNAVRVEAAEDSNRVSATANVIIRPDPVATVEVHPSFMVVERGETQHYEATAIDRFGNGITGLSFLWQATGGEITQDGVFTAGTESGSHEVNVSAKFKKSVRTGKATVPIPPVWIPAGNFRGCSSCTATLLTDGKVLIVGDRDVAEIYDPVENSFTFIRYTPCIHGRNPTATLLDDNRVLITGGQREPRCAEIYDHETGAFTEISKMNEEHWAHSATLLPDGRVLLVGGYRRQSNILSESHRVAELFDPSTETFSRTGSLKTARQAPAAVLLPTGKVLIVSGRSRIWDEIKRMDVSKVCHRSAEIYDPATETFKNAGSLSYSTCSVLTTLLDNGDVLTTRDRPVELFDYRQMRFRSTGKMMMVRGEPTATMLKNGQVLIAGGWQNGGGRTATAEIYDPKSGTFFAVDSMSTERSGHGATLLPNGWVLVVGGCCGASYTAELFIPSNLP